MKALPLAALGLACWCLVEKKYETRSWATAYRAP